MCILSEYNWISWEIVSREKDLSTGNKASVDALWVDLKQTGWADVADRRRPKLNIISRYKYGNKQMNE